MNATQLFPSFVPLPYSGKALIIEPLDYNNPYDFHKPHRHDYFEIILITGGTGKQVIDCKQYTWARGSFMPYTRGRYTSWKGVLQKAC